MASDLRATIDYYVDKAGFRLRGVWGDPPDFAVIGRDDARLMLAQAPDGAVPPPYWRVRDKLWNACYRVDDARAVHAELVARGADIDYGLRRRPYDVLQFGIQDPDGCDIAFGQDLDDYPDRGGPDDAAPVGAGTHREPAA